MTPPDSLRRLGGALGWGVAARGARFVLGLAGTALVLRSLGPHDYGILAVVRTALAYLVILVAAGIGQGMLRYIPEWRIAGERGRVKAVLARAVLVQGALWLLSASAIWAARPLWGPGAGAARDLFLLGVALLLPEVLGGTAGNLASAYYDSKRQSMAVVLSTVVYLLALVPLLESGAGGAGVLVASAISNAVLAGVIFLGLPGYLAEPPAPGAGDGAGTPVGRALRYSLPFIAIGLLNLITWRQSEVLFLGHFRGAREAGFFDLAYRLPQTILEFVPGAIWPLVMAGSAEAFSRDPGALQRTTAAYYRLLYLLVAPLAVGGFLTGDLLVDVVGGGEYAPAGIFCRLLFLVFGLSFLATPLSMAFYVLERPWVGFWLYVINASINVGLDLVLIPRWGLWGALIPVSLVIAASPFMNLWTLRRLGVRIVPPGGFLLRVSGAALVLLFLWPLRGVLDGLSGLLALTGLGGVLFVLAVRWFRVFGPEERRLMERAGPSVWNRLRPVVCGPGREV